MSHSSQASTSALRRSITLCSATSPRSYLRLPLGSTHALFNGGAEVPPPLCALAPIPSHRFSATPLHRSSTSRLANVAYVAVSLMDLRIVTHAIHGALVPTLRWLIPNVRGGMA